ncbi:hypothetical protein FNV43_RR23700 [Rhamnella rubrinervis]|uniref:Acyl transferase 4 n=1 Tax=Rhamnella rubrinervis TaxID=2594499 RepID=A0A8K0DYE4_9ROSA|nr:hypothetical protein FNV43_RR23700 [Rhamnella rubrinervis]
MALSVTRTRHSLVKPSEKTPSTTLDLSVLDKTPVLRCIARTLHVYRHGHDHGPAATSSSTVIRGALSRALVPYYPLAGRLIESNLQIECSGQGVWFVEAFANTTLDALNYFDDHHVFAIPYDDLLPHDQFPDGDPLVQMQVTGFACGGFVIGLKFCHSICDGLGAAQFLNAVGELARGAEHPRITPVWHRDFINTSSSGVPLPHHVPPPPPPMQINYRLEQSIIDISMDNINKLKQEFKESTGGHISCSTFDIVAASFWSCRTKAILISKLENDRPQETSTFVFFANCRQLLEPPLPEGFYGNCFFPVVIKAGSEWLAGASNGDVVKLIQQAKTKLPSEVAKYLNKKNGSQQEEDPFTPPVGYNTLFLSEWGRLGFNQVDFGWGPPVHIIPIQGSSIIPAGIMGWLPPPNKGVRLMTWCTEEAHCQPFLRHISKLYSSS